jgi:hypothetical protein
MSPERSVTYVSERTLEVLLAAKVALRGLDGNVPKKKLDLFEFTSCLVAQTSTRSAEIVRS